MAGFDPLSLATGATSAGLQSLGGLLQVAGSHVKRKERDLENFNNSYQPNQSILDYYQKAYNKYNPNAYNSAAYQQGQTNINSNLATGISATQDRRAGVGSVGALVANANRASLGNIANAEKLQNQNLAQLGHATGMKAAEDRSIFDRKYNLLAMKAGQAATQKNNGFQNIFGGLSNLGSLASVGLGNKTNALPTATGTGLNPALWNGTYGSDVPMTGGLQNRRTPNFYG